VLAAPMLFPVAAGAAATQAAPDPTLPEVAAQAPIEVSREGGLTRIQTAIEVSKRVFDASNPASVVVLARHDEYADALTGGPLAAALGGPILLTPGDGLHPDTLAELQRIDPAEVILLGGSAALSAAVEDALKAAGFSTRRLAGEDRFETGTKIAADLVGAETGGPVFLVEGANANPNRGWPDGVSISAYAAYGGMPVLPVVTGTVPESVQTFLTAYEPSEIIIIGGTAAISQDVEDSLTPAEDEPGPVVRRLKGDNRYETSAAIYDEAVTRGLAPDVKWLATGDKFPDALTGGASAGGLGHSLLLVPGFDVEASAPVFDRLTVTYDRMTDVVILGGTAAISALSEQKIKDEVAPETFAPASLCLTVLHNNDSESKLVNAGSGLELFGGADRFATTMLTEQARAALERDDCTTSAAITVSSGDNFLAGIEFNASRDKGVPYYDSMLLDYLNYDAVALGNHDFDFGPAVTSDLIEGAVMDGDDIVFLSANLDFSAEPELQPHVDDGDLLPSVALPIGDHVVGVIGITPPYLRQISSPGDNIVVNGVDANGDTDINEVAQIINDEAADLIANEDADVIVVISHLQNLNTDKDLVPLLEDVDVVVAGGGDEVLAKPGELLVPGDELITADTYPTWVGDVPVVTTAGNYKYVGRLVTRFDATGALLDVDERNSRMVRVAGEPMPDGVTPDAWVKANIVDPVIEYAEELDNTEIATSTVALDGRRSSVRTQESNVGDLLADSYVTATIDGLGLAPADQVVGITNGGGIRKSAAPASTTSRTSTSRSRATR
jgi:5'-nucleotidase / UDP-sugar diphosphatase